jgi:Ca2+/Na+ antiporter
VAIELPRKTHRDISACYAAFTAGNTSLAISGIFGAGLFVTTVVIGAIALAVPYTVTRRPFARDVVCYLAATLFVYAILFDGQISLVEAVALLAVYVLYVVTVVVGRQIYQSRKRRRLAAISGGGGGDVIATVVGSIGHATPSAYGPVTCDVGNNNNNDDDDDDDDALLLSAGRASVNVAAAKRRVQPVMQLGDALAPIEWAAFLKLAWYWKLATLIQVSARFRIEPTVWFVSVEVGRRGAGRRRGDG